MRSETLRELLVKQGAQEQQLNSKVVELCENAIADMSEEEINAITLETIKELTNKFASASQRASMDLRRIENTLSKVNSAERKADQLSKNINGVIEDIAIVPTEQSKQAIYIFRSVLETTKEIFGADLPEEVMQTAIEAGSYGMWRSIMGESKPLKEIRL